MVRSQDSNARVREGEERINHCIKYIQRTLDNRPYSRVKDFIRTFCFLGEVYFPDSRPVQLSYLAWEREKH